MPSGKKARGRQNRAKKEATLTAAQRSQWEPTILRNNDASNNVAASSCEHTLAVLPRIPQVSPAVSFMNCLANEGFFDKATRFTGDSVVLCFQSLWCFPDVRDKESERSLATNLLLRYVRNVLVHDSAIEGENWFHDRAQNQVVICIMVNLLELFGTYSDWNVVEMRAIRMNNKLAGGNRRDLVKFVAKRLPCTCLKKLHSAVREKVAKRGACMGSGKFYPRSQLRVCTGCRYINYCSRECQRAHWPNHKGGCGYPEVMSPDLPAHYVFFKRNRPSRARAVVIPTK